MQPVQPDDAHIEDARGDVTADLLHPAERGADLRIIDLGEVVARVLADLPACTVKEVDGGFFQRTLGDAQFDDGLCVHA